MAIELSDIALLLAFGFLIYGAWRSYAVKEIALAQTRKHCRAFDVQLLDESVVMRGIWLKRDVGTWRFRRSYWFEFTTTGEQRYHGVIMMMGARVESIQLEPHRIDTSE
jgi:hypothetical protein